MGNGDQRGLVHGSLIRSSQKSEGTAGIAISAGKSFAVIINIVDTFKILVGNGPVALARFFIIGTSRIPVAIIVIVPLAIICVLKWPPGAHSSEASADIALFIAVSPVLISLPKARLILVIVARALLGFLIPWLRDDQSG